MAQSAENEPGPGRRDRSAGSRVESENEEDARAAGERAAAMALRLGLPRLASAALDGVCADYVGRGLYGPARPVTDPPVDVTTA